MVVINQTGKTYRHSEILLAMSARTKFTSLVDTILYYTYPFGIYLKIKRKQKQNGNPCYRTCAAPGCWFLTLFHQEVVGPQTEKALGPSERWPGFGGRREGQDLGCSGSASFSCWSCRCATVPNSINRHVGELSKKKKPDTLALGASSTYACFSLLFIN
jgi:hypothetical protein